MIKVEFNNHQENPFSGLDNCLALYNNAPINESLLNAAYNECKNDLEKLKLFYILCFQVGDITNREHNIFHGKKVDSGGSARRDDFREVINWMYHTHPEQFRKFLFAGLFNEYSCFDLLIQNRVQTQKKTNKVIKVINQLNDSLYVDMITDYFVQVINGSNPFNKILIAKFLTLPRFEVRKNHKQMLPETIEIMKSRANFLAILSDKMGWEYVWNGKGYARFDGYRRFRKQYNQELESVLFSTGRIKEFDRESFIKWLNFLPSGARFRVKNRVLYSEDGKKYPTLIKWFAEWEQFKETKQAEQRRLEEKVRQNLASEEDLEKLKKVKKEAKVTTGAINFKTIYDGILTNNYDALAVENFVQNKVNLPYNNLIIIDESGSMRGAPFNFACFLASVLLVKNPDDDGRNLVGMFANSGRFLTSITQRANSRNSLLRSSVTKVAPQPFVDPKLSFIDNYNRISTYLRSEFKSGGTYFEEIPRMIQRAAQSDPTVIDYLKQYPVWTVVSDGDLNSSISSEASLRNFFNVCEETLGFKPFVIFIDVSSYSSVRALRWKGINNVIHIVNDPNKIETILTNFKDLQIFDIYTPLQSIYASNRYNPVKENTIND